MQPGKYNFNAPQGATFSRTLTYKADNVAVNLTGFSARMQVRKNVTDSSTILSLVSPTNITLGGAAGTITVTVTATAMAAVAAGTYVYDLEIESGSGIVTRLIEGKFIVTPEVTR